MAQINERSALPDETGGFFGMRLPIIAIVFAARLIMDSGTRILYPFIPQISAGLGLTVIGFSWLLFIKSMVGLIVPIFGVLADRYGQRAMMVLGLLCEAIGVLGVALTRQWWTALPMIFFGLSLVAFLPAQQAYISNQVPYKKRGRALAAVEFAWAVVAILILPIIGWLIVSFGWQTPFWLLGLISFLGASCVWRWLPPTRQRVERDMAWSAVRGMWRKPEVLATIGVALLLFVTVSTLLSVWGIWLSADFGLDAVAIGTVAIGFGFAELSGSGMSSLFIDRIGARRGSILGLLLTATTILVLPLTRQHLAVAIPGLILSFTLLEFTVVSLVPLYSEQFPAARSTLLALAFLGSGIGSAVGPPIATTLWEGSGLWPVCAVASSCLLGACAIVGKFLHDPPNVADAV